MGMGKNSMNAVELTERGGQVILLDAKIKGKRFSIEDVHDSKWIYEIAYRHDGVDYSGETSLSQSVITCRNGGADKILHTNRCQEVVRVFEGRAIASCWAWCLKGIRPT
jgi:hypothetical protein